MNNNDANMIRNDLNVTIVGILIVAVQIGSLDFAEHA